MFFKLHPSLLWDDEPAAASPVETPAPAAATPVEPVTPEPGPAPWAQDLEQYIQDESARADADRYLREKWQPRTTQLEQQLAETKPASELWKDLNEDPIGTYVAIASELLGEDTAKAIEELIQAGVNPAAAVEAVTETPAAAPVDPVLAQMKAEYEANQQRSLFDSELERIKTLPEAAGLLIDREAIAPFVLQSDGDFDAALVGYKAWVDSLRAHYAPAPDAPAPTPPPNVLGTQLGDAPPATPPTVKNYGGDYDSAIDDFLAESRAARGPTTVGTV